MMTINVKSEWDIVNFYTVFDNWPKIPKPNPNAKAKRKPKPKPKAKGKKRKNPSGGEPPEKRRKE